MEVACIWSSSFAYQLKTYTPIWNKANEFYMQLLVEVSHFFQKRIPELILQDTSFAMFMILNCVSTLSPELFNIKYLVARRIYTHWGIKVSLRYSLLLKTIKVS